MASGIVSKLRKDHLDEVLDLLYHFNYPNIARDKTGDFCDAFCNLIRAYNDEDSPHGFLIESFRQMLRYAGRHGDLVFLHDNENNLLVEEYYMLYIGRCYTYKNSIHHFDNENVIHAKMQATTMIADEKAFINYEFLDSKQSVLIQVSDVFVGLLSKLFEYLDSVTLEEIEGIASSVSSIQLSNLAKIESLISRSAARHQTMIQDINDINLTLARMQKLCLLIETATL